MAKEKTMADIYNEMTPEQQVCVAYYVNEATAAVEKVYSQQEPPKNSK